MRKGAMLLVIPSVAATATAAAVGDSGRVAHGVNLADLNLSIDRLTSKLERLTVSCCRCQYSSCYRI